MWDSNSRQLIRKKWFKPPRCLASVKVQPSLKSRKDFCKKKNFFFEENEATAAKHYVSKNSEHVENKSKHRSKKIINLGPTSAIRGGTSLFLEPEPSPGLWNLIMDRAKVWLRDIAFFDLSGARLWSSDNASWSFRLVAPLSLSLV